MRFLFLGAVTAHLASNHDRTELKRWVTHEVLPSIRKTGGYLHTTPEMTEEEIMDRAVLLSKKKIEARRTQREELAPKADSWSESN